jgi:hypothetical protein
VSCVKALPSASESTAAADGAIWSAASRHVDLGFQNSSASFNSSPLIDPTPRYNCLKLLMFDCDGTLVDSQHKICAAMDQAYSAHGLPPRTRLLSVLGLSQIEALTALGQGGLVDQYKARLPCLHRRPQGSRYSPAPVR